jgi:hypothetical protein
MEFRLNGQSPLHDAFRAQIYLSSSQGSDASPLGFNLVVLRDALRTHEMVKRWAQEEPELPLWEVQARIILLGHHC